MFGWMNARIQTWFPFTIQVCLNGREYLARQMDRGGMRYERQENCFPWVEDVAKAQRLSDELLKMDWPSALKPVARRLNPAHEKMLAPYRVDYYWSVHQSEWATDILFKSADDLARIYPALVRGAISSFSSPDVMRFLGKKPNGNFRGEVVSDYRKRPEGIRVKHWYKTNSVKVYDKHGSVLRVETTINEPYDFKVYRPKEGDPDGQPDWRKMRQGVADLYRRAQVSQQSNDRYVEALASLDTDRPLRELAGPICRRVRWKGRWVRALRPWSEEDQPLLSAISRGEFSINGFRNRDLVAILFPQSPRGPQEKRQAVARVTQRLRLLRAHRLIRKVSHTQRYVLTHHGREIVTALLQTQLLTLQQLQKAAA